MLLEDTDVYVDAQGYPLFTMSICATPLGAALPSQAQLATE